VKVVNKVRVLLPAAGVVAASVGGACAWLLLTADHAVAVSPPNVTAGVRKVCADLYSHLPATVDGQGRDQVSPASTLTAAWGRSPIVLTCGAATPAVLNPADKAFDPSAQAVYANGVSWLPVQVSNGYEFYTTRREVYVEVFVPSSYNLADGNPGMDAPTDLSAAVIAGTPTVDGTSGPDVSPA
jgi:hypothetical protein